MPLDLSAESLLRAGSGLLYLATGLFVAIAGRARERNVLAGAALSCFGANFVAFNLLGRDPGTSATGLVVAASCLAASSGLLVTLGWRLAPDAAARRVLVALVAWSCLAAVPVVAFFLPEASTIAADADLPSNAAAAYVALTAFTVVAFGAIAGFTHVALTLLRRTAPEAQVAVLLAAPFMAFLAFFAGQQLPNALESRLSLAFVAALAVLVVPLVGLVQASRRPGSRVARAGLLLVLVAVLLAAVANTAFSLRLSQFGVIGIARILAIVPFLYGIFGLDLLGVPLPRRVFRGGTLASVGLAVLFVAAQIMQNFLGARFGIVVGGAVAGFAVFAVMPLQKAAERVVAKHPKRARPSSGAELYRKLVEMAWADGSLGAKERLMLRQVREHIGLGFEEADAIDAEVAVQHVERSRAAASREPPGDA